MEYKILFALMTTLLTGVTLHVPIRTLITAGATGTIGWSIYQSLSTFSNSSIIAAGCGAIAVGLAAEIFARLQKEPTTIYITTGIIPLVPGLKAYNAVQNILNAHYTQGMAMLLQTALISAYIAAGLAVVSIVGKILK